MATTTQDRRDDAYVQTWALALRIGLAAEWVLDRIRLYVEREQGAGAS